MNRKRNKIRIGITMGDPSGIGTSIIAKAIPAVQDIAEIIIIGDRWVFEKSSIPRHKLVRAKFIDLKNVSRKKFAFGEVDAGYGRASIEYLDKALELIKKNEIECLVTAPISKESINLAGYKFNGHTEYFEANTLTKFTVMMLLNRRLKFSLITRHTPLKNVSDSLSVKSICDNISITYNALRDLFGIKKPRIVVCGLNPHASDNGIIGQEENRLIKPALERLRSRIGGLDGPLGADVAIGMAYRRKYDCVIAQFHDQALIPLKLTDSSTGVNITLGLPFIRTSPLHGTAFDIAGTNLANPASFIEATRVAAKCALNLKKG